MARASIQSSAVIMALVVSAAAQTPLYTFRGDAPYDWFGNVARAGDVDRDGFEDLIAGP